jgi:hypothetical protein
MSLFPVSAIFCFTELHPISRVTNKIRAKSTHIYLQAGHAMLIKKPADIKSSDITAPALYKQRRRFIQSSAAFLLGAGWLSMHKLVAKEKSIQQTQLLNRIRILQHRGEDALQGCNRIQ